MATIVSVHALLSLCDYSKLFPVHRLEMGTNALPVERKVNEMGSLQQSRIRPYESAHRSHHVARVGD